MHDYAIIDHNRANIGRWLGLASIILSYLVSAVSVCVGEISSFKMVTGFAISSGAFYFILYYLFNKILWKKEWLKLPNIQGVWSVDGTTINQEGKTSYEWSGELDIEQTWDKIVITLKTEKSKSESYVATLKKEPGSKGGWALYYSYKNEPEINEQCHLSSHKGFCEITFNKDNKTASGNYFNNFGRYTFGQLILKKN